MLYMVANTLLSYIVDLNNTILLRLLNLKCIGLCR